MLGTFTLMTLASFEAVTPLPLAAQMWNASREAAKRLFEIVDEEPAVKDDGRYSQSEIRIDIEIMNFDFPIFLSPTPLNRFLHYKTSRSRFHRKIHCHCGSERRGEKHDREFTASDSGITDQEKSLWAACRSRR